MPNSKLEQEPSNKLAGEYISRTKRGETSDELRLWHNLLDAPKMIGWDKNAVLTRVILRQVDDGWQAIVKAKRGPLAGVAFVNGASWSDCLKVLSLKIASSGLDWKKDKYE